MISNVEFGLKMRGVVKAERREIAKEILARIGLSEFWRHYPSELSGGMQQRVNLARVLVNRPEVLLMDEPFGALDAQTRLQMQEMLLGLWEEYGMTVVFVTHDVDEAILLSDRVLIMSRRPGRITAEIPVSLGRPRTLELLDERRLPEGQARVPRLCASREQSICRGTEYRARRVLLSGERSF